MNYTEAMTIANAADDFRALDQLVRDMTAKQDCPVLDCRTRLVEYALRDEAAQAITFDARDRPQLNYYNRAMVAVHRNELLPREVVEVIETDNRYEFEVSWILIDSFKRGAVKVGVYEVSVT